jgi:hypothetical protein
MFQPVRWVSYLLAPLALLVAGLSQAGVYLNSDMTQEKLAGPGESYRGTIVLKNADDAPAEAKVYQTDYSFAADGSNLYGEPGRLPRSNAKWISLSRELVTVPAKGTERIDYEVTVPAGKGAGLSGSYWSMIMVEPITKQSRESAAAVPEGTVQVIQTMRYGVQVVTQIGNTGTTNLTFANPQLIKQEGKRLFAIDVTNTGERSLRPGLWLELYTEAGNPVGKLQGEARRLHPGTSVRFLIDLGQTPNGKYLGMVAADGTGDNLFGANVELELK